MRTQKNQFVFFLAPAIFLGLTQTVVESVGNRPAVLPALSGHLLKEQRRPLIAGHLQQIDERARLLLGQQDVMLEGAVVARGDLDQRTISSVRRRRPDDCFCRVPGQGGIFIPIQKPQINRYRYEILISFRLKKEED